MLAWLSVLQLFMQKLLVWCKNGIPFRFVPGNILSKRLLPGVAMVLLVSACGFHLRGESDFPFKTIYVAGSESTPLGNQLRRALKTQTKAQLVQDEKDADVVLQLISESHEKVILSLNVQGRVSEYTLVSRLDYRVRNRFGKEFIAPSTLRLTRVLSFNENLVLAKQSEEAMLYSDMQGDLVQQLVRRLSVMKME